MSIIVEVLGLLCVLLSNEIQGEERQLLLNHRTDVCPNGIVFRESCKLCYCVEQANGFVLRKCETKFTNKECDILGRWAHCDPENLFYDYDRDCEGECKCNEAKNVTVCENLPCNNSVLMFLGFYNSNDLDSIDDAPMSKMFPFHGKRMRRQEPDVTTETSTTAESATEIPTTVDSKTVEPATVDSKTVEPATVDSKTVESATVDSKTVESATVDSKTVESATVDSTTVEPATVGGEASRELTDNAQTDPANESVTTSNEGEQVRDTDEVEDCEKEETDENCEEEETEGEDGCTDDEVRPRSWEGDLNTLPEREPFANRITEDCPHGNFYRQGCRVCYCFPKVEQAIPSNYCVDLISRPACTYWADKVHCNGSRLLFNYIEECEGSCKCTRSDDPLETYTTCRYIPCTDEILAFHKRYTESEGGQWITRPNKVFQYETTPPNFTPFYE